MTAHATFAGPNLPATLPDVEAIEAGYHRAMDLYTTAFTKIAEADDAIRTAYSAIEAVTPGTSFHCDRDAREIDEFHKAVQLPAKDIYLRTARKLLTLRCWHYVVDRCGMQQLMDAQAKKELDEQLRYVPDRTGRDGELITEDEAAKGAPPFTAENVRATMARFAGEAGMIWRRGIANAFSQLDRRFRSHDGFKVGSRVVLTHFASYDSGRIDTYGRTAETFRDIERTLLILDGRDPRHARSDFLWQVDKERHTWRPMQSEHENDYLKVRVYKNGNGHLWFKRDDLVELVNKELAAYYGEVIGDARTKEPDPLENRAVAHARLYGFYPTPTELAERIAAQVPYYEGTLRILEPSAGTGNLAFALVRPREYSGYKIRHRVDAVEIQPDLATALRNSGKLNRVTTGDFLQLRPDPTALYDGVVMNPPFDRERDIDHVTHALKFVKPDGWLLSIMSAGTEFRETAKGTAFRKLLAEREGWMLDLPPGSFSEVGTHVNTMLVGIGIRRSWSI
jgi:predicted RNA methylase